MTALSIVAYFLLAVGGSAWIGASFFIRPDKTTSRIARSVKFFGLALFGVGSVLLIIVSLQALGT